MRSRASFFKCEYPLLSLRSSSSFLRFLPRLPVTPIPPFIFPSITRCRSQFLRKMWPIQLAFRFLISFKNMYNEIICSWVKRDKLDATCFIITLFSVQHVSDVNTPILRSVRLIHWVTSWVVSGSMCVGVTLQCGYGGVVSVCRLKH